MVPKHLRKSTESLGGDQESLMPSVYELEGKMKNDKSILRQPIDTGVRGVKDLIKAVVGGTQELQELLLNECTIIYECKICRNLFRSLVNFISHKRIYCIKNFSYFTQETTKQEDELFQQDSNKLETDLKFNNDVNLKKAKVWLTNDKIVPNNIKIEENDYLKPTRRIKISPFKIAGKCDIARIADGLNQKGRREYLMGTEEIAGSTINSDLDDNMLSGKCNEPKSPQVNNLNVRISNKFIQDTRESEFSNLIRSQAIEKIHSYSEAVLQENGKFRVTPQGMKIEDHENLENNKCNICNTHFISKQILTRHVQVHHKERICYPCPICRTFFPSPSSTYRHLSKDHHKTEQQIRRLRPKVLAKGSRRKLVENRARLEVERPNSYERLNGNFEGDLCCSICGKLFNRQAVLRVHSISCKEKESPSVKSCSKQAEPNKCVVSRVGAVGPEPEKPTQSKSGILVRRDYCKSIPAHVEEKSVKAKNPGFQNQVYKGHSLNRVNKWRTVLQKLQSKNGFECTDKTNIQT